MLGSVSFGQVRLDPKLNRCQDPFLDIHRAQLEVFWKSQFPGQSNIQLGLKNDWGIEFNRVSYFSPGKPEAVAHLDFRVGPQPQKIFIDDVRVNQEFREQKLSHFLFILALNAVGSVRIVGTGIGLMNKTIFLQHYEKTGDIKTSLEQTPAYKIRKAAGFTEILDEEPFLIDLDDQDYDSWQLIFHMR